MRLEVSNLKLEVSFLRLETSVFGSEASVFRPEPSGWRSETSNPDPESSISGSDVSGWNLEAAGSGPAISDRRPAAARLDPARDDAICRNCDELAKTCGMTDLAHLLKSGVSLTTAGNQIMAPRIAVWNVSRWNDGSVWGPARPQPEGRKMKAILNLKNANPEEICRVGKNVNKGFADNPTDFVNPKPPLATSSAHNADLDAKIGDVKTKQEAYTASLVARDTAVAVVLADLNISLPYVQEISGGDPVIIAKANLGTRSPNAPIGQLAQVGNFSLTRGDNPGEVDGHFDPVDGRKIYEIAKCTGDPAVEANWTLIKTCSPSKFTLTGQASGTRLWLRVRAKAPKDESDGPWSQPATIIVP